MCDEYIEVNYSFRMMVSRQLKYKEVLKKYPHLEFEVTNMDFSRKGEPPGKCISLQMTEGVDYNSLKDICNELEIMRNDFDIFVSVVSEYDSRIIDVPLYVDDVSRLTNAPFVFSYTIV